MITIHEIAVRQLAASYPDLHRHKFGKAVSTLTLLDWHVASLKADDTGSEECADTTTSLIRETADNAYHIIPDGWLADFKNQMLIVFEVEDSHRLSIEKLEAYWKVYFYDIEPLDWGLAIISVSRWGLRQAVPYFDYIRPDIAAGECQNELMNNLFRKYKIELEIANHYTRAECDWDHDWISQNLQKISTERDIDWTNKNIRNEFFSIVTTKRNHIKADLKDCVV
jgi:hypothetical protein